MLEGKELEEGEVAQGLGDKALDPALPGVKKKRVWKRAGLGKCEHLGHPRNKM